MAVICSKLDLILEGLEQATTFEGLQVASEALRDHYEVDHVVYHWVDSSGDQYGCGTYSQAWQERYLSQNYMRIDPVILGCYQRFHPVDWKRLDWSGKAARALLLEAIEYGIGNQGFSVPIRGPNGQFALFTVNKSCADPEWEAFAEANRRDLILIAHYFNEKALELEPGRTPEAPRALSPREVDAMTLIAIGYNRAQVADTLSISEHTLRVYIESARFKLGALNTTHAVARALSRGLIVV
ncbi:DNA-binding transcriptional regulator, CsgD family [Sulfitobacter marinus]|uniref:DNA-binding transcriptional regulator, CsgD family n=1 Tax=Sulfitobacter marinus TaxID=394264 RepID=A0A1I6U9Q5_9RHOB|nr:LuxR family transcriptional regulator [Sulfitobacter marinus]SFS98142.1 DNA-binding transcriptional regulator, CsgD family [Sulfitobacter marinus]